MLGNFERVASEVGPPYGNCWASSIYKMFVGCLQLTTKLGSEAVTKEHNGTSSLNMSYFSPNSGPQWPVFSFVMA